jgi:hypothetical protein
MHPADALLTALHKPRSTYQTFPDHSNSKPQILHGPHPHLTRRLTTLNHEGQGIFHMVNNGDLQGRRAENVTSITAYFADLDGTPLHDTLPLTPTAIIESSPGRYHLYWRITNAPRDTFPHVQKHIALLLDADPSVHDLPRVLRLPGYQHTTRDPFTTRITSLEPDNAYTHETFMDAFAIPNPPPARKPMPPAVTSYKNRTKPNTHKHERTISTAAARIANAPEGTRNTTLYRVAAAVANQIKTGQVTRTEAEQELEHAALTAGLQPHEIANTLRSAMRHAA